MGWKDELHNYKASKETSKTRAHMRAEDRESSAAHKDTCRHMDPNTGSRCGKVSIGPYCETHKTDMPSPKRAGRRWPRQKR